MLDFTSYNVCDILKSSNCGLLSLSFPCVSAILGLGSRLTRPKESEITCDMVNNKFMFVCLFVVGLFLFFPNIFNVFSN